MEMEMELTEKVKNESAITKTAGASVKESDAMRKADGKSCTGKHSSCVGI